MADGIPAWAGGASKLRQDCSRRLEREVVLGDLAETDRGMWRGLGDVLGLAARRQLALWRSWRPWAASFGLALPASLFLMGCSVAASAAFAGLSGEPAQARSALAFSFQTFSCDLLGMDGGVCCELDLAGHAMGQRAGDAVRPVCIASR